MTQAIQKEERPASCVRPRYQMSWTHFMITLISSTLAPFTYSALSAWLKLTFCPPLFFFHAEPSSSSVKLHQCVISYSMLALWIQRRHGSTGHDVKICVIFFFPQCPPVNLNMYPLTVYNHMNAVIMCCGWDLDPQCIMESDKDT